MMDQAPTGYDLFKHRHFVVILSFFSIPNSVNQRPHNGL